MSLVRKLKKLSLSVLLVFAVDLRVTYANPQEFETITVKKGDTLSKISGQYLEDPKRWQELLQYNNIPNANLIRPGLELKIPVYLAKKAVGVVVFRSGKTMISRQDIKDWQPIAIKDPIYSKNILKTAQKSNLHIQVGTDSMLKIYPDSELVFDPPNVQQTTAFSYFLQRGRLNAQITKAEGRSYVVRTPAAMAAVRGTEFDTEVNRDRRTTLRCYEGEVEISAQKKKVTVPAGYGVMVDYGKPPGDLFALPGAPVIIQER